MIIDRQLNHLLRVGPKTVGWQDPKEVEADPESVWLRANVEVWGSAPGRFTGVHLHW